MPFGKKHRAGPGARQALPDFIGREAQDRRQPAHVKLRDMIQGGLRRAAFEAVGGAGILPILDDIQIKTAHLHHAELVQHLVDQMKVESIVGADDLFL